MTINDLGLTYPITGTYNGGLGCTITANSDVTLKSFEVKGTYLSATLRDSSNNILQSGTKSGQVFTFDYDLVSGTQYGLVVEGTGGTYAGETGVSFPIVLTDITVTGGYLGGNFNWVNIYGILVVVTESGTPPVTAKIPSIILSSDI